MEPVVVVILKDGAITTVACTNDQEVRVIIADYDHINITHNGRIDYDEDDVPVVLDEADVEYENLQADFLAEIMGD